MKRLFLSLWLIVFATGCSQLKLGYNHGSWILRQKINGYASFSSSQRDRIHSEIDGFFDHNRKEMLPLYAAYLRKLDARLTAGNLKAADATALRHEFYSLYHQTMRPLMGPAATILLTLTPSQIDELEKAIEHQNHKFRDEWLAGDSDQRFKKRADRTIDSTQDWAGGLSRAQRLKIQELSRALPYMTELWLTNRQRQQAGALRLLREHTSLDVFETYLREWLIEPEQHRPKEQLKQFMEFETALDQFFIDIWNLLDSQQQSQVHDRIKHYIQDFEELHRND